MGNGSRARDVALTISHYLFPIHYSVRPFMIIDASCPISSHKFADLSAADDALAAHLDRLS